MFGNARTPAFRYARTQWKPLWTSQAPHFPGLYKRTAFLQAQTLPGPISSSPVTYHSNQSTICLISNPNKPTISPGTPSPLHRYIIMDHMVPRSAFTIATFSLEQVPMKFFRSFTLPTMTMTNWETNGVTYLWRPGKVCKVESTLITSARPLAIMA